MTDYIPHEVGRIRRDKALEYYLSRPEHNKTIYEYMPIDYRDSLAVSESVDWWSCASSRHWLGYYKQGVN
jgi:hypothetical protein